MNSVVRVFQVEILKIYSDSSAMAKRKRTPAATSEGPKDARLLPQVRRTKVFIA